MDLDGDGRLSLYELEFFYQEQTQRMECLGLQAMPFEDALCQMVDMIKPSQDNFLTLGDLKRSQAVRTYMGLALSYYAINQGISHLRLRINKLHKHREVSFSDEETNVGDRRHF